MTAQSITLKRWLPMLLIGTAAVLWTFMTWHAYDNLQADLTAHSLREATDDLSVLQMQMELMLSRDQSDDAGRLLSAWAVDAPLQDLVSVDDHGNIMHATRLELIGRPVAKTLAAFDQQRFDRLQQDNRPDVGLTSDGQRIIAYIPLTMIRPAGESRSSRTGALFAIYDLGSERLRIWDRAWRSSLKFGLVLLFAALILIAFVRYFITSPFQGLIETVKDLTEGDAGARSSISGKGELAELGQVFNKMGRQLEERGRQRDESLVALRRVNMELHRFKRIFESVNDLVALVSKDYVYLAANPLYLSYHDKAYDEVIGHFMIDVVGAELFNSNTRPAAERCMNGEVVQSQKWLEFKGVGLKCMSTSCSPYYGTKASINGFVIIGRDVTREVELQLQVQQAQKLETVGQLAGGVAHDFNNMCGVILGYTDMALDDADKEHVLHHQLTEIRIAAKRSADLARALLTFASKQAVSPRLLDLNQTVEGMLNMLRQLIGENIELQWQPGEGLVPVKMDPSQLDQLVVNLCLNARDAVDAVGRITIRTGMVTLDSGNCDNHPDAVPGEYLVLTISDDGHGMDEQTQARLFEPFFTTKEGGTGLGLASVYGAVRQAGGFIRLFSEVNNGATFTIHLPVAQGEIDSLSETATMDANQCGDETILLVEDEPALLDVTRKMLERKGYNVLAALTPAEAIRLAEAHSTGIELVLTDVIMSEMSGPDLVYQLKSSHPHFKYLLMSGYTASEKFSPDSSGADLAFLPKPFSSKELAAKVREVLGD